ncbi:MAG: S-adenosylmethionine:tRNA ribosyltransferase-isomerase, partial [Xanthomonadales bacterium]|nr:S-adenosylmethionine:tRNA ribosyltransferase-isomerase [Xanthomonadales bacterium]
MRKADFSYHLPPELIAQHPVEPRTASRLLAMDRRSGALRDSRFASLPEFLRPGDLLVFNDTRVIKARLFGRKATGGKVEILVERLLDDQRVLAQLKASKAPAEGSVIHVEDCTFRVTGRHGGFFELEAEEPVAEVLDAHGHMPLPPYIRRPDTSADEARYQTVYAREPGAVAAPTAGLHFDQGLLTQLAQSEVSIAYL